MRKIVLPGASLESDLLLDDSVLAFRSDNGLVIITGCSHTGICNITEYARMICGEKRIIAIIGGLHLLTPDHIRIKRTGEYLRVLHFKALHACHCTSLMVKLILANYCPLQEVGIGMHIEWQGSASRWLTFFLHYYRETGITCTADTWILHRSCFRVQDTGRSSSSWGERL